MEKEKLTILLDKAVSKELRYRVPRFIKKYPRRLEVKNRKKGGEESEKITKGTSFWGGEFELFLPETVSSAIYSCGYFEENLSRSFIELLNVGDTFIDVGAHIGYFSKLASSIVGEDGKVFSFEPTQSTYKFLVKNTSGEKNIKAINKAVFSKKCEIEFNDYGPRYSAMNSFTAGRFEDEKKVPFDEIKVEAIKLDDFIVEHNLNPNLIKIDAESAEYDILLGMQSIMKNIRPIITVEVGDFGISGIKTSKELILFVMGFGYQPYVYDEKLIKHQLEEKYSYQNIILIPDSH